MAQVFPPGANWLVKWSFFGGGGAALLFAAVASAFYWSPEVTRLNVYRGQDIPFSHLRHVQGNGIDCRYCHTSVESSPFAGIPATETCMSCHSQVFSDQPILEPARESWRTGEPMEWARVYDLPDFVYFNHSIHLNKGVGCSTCHGRVDEMPLTYKATPLRMSWCLQCHRSPEKYIRPREEVFNMEWVATKDQILAWEASEAAPHDWEAVHGQRELGAQLVDLYNIEKRQLTNCSICHR